MQRPSSSLPSPLVSVILCTHNPRPDYFRRTLEALRAQADLGLRGWELLLVDNRSTPPLRESLDLSWHPSAHVLIENQLGLVHARRCGIAAARGELIVFVDDDNLLACDYLAQAVAIAEGNPTIGAFGGSCRGIFETTLPGWIKPYLPGLAVEEITQDHRSRSYDWSLASPYGAGLCTRREVASRWSQRVGQDALLSHLGRSGKVLMSGEDTDLVWTALELGFESGRFARLKLDHLIGASRLTETYIVRLFGGFAASRLVLEASRGRWPRPERLPFLRLVYDLAVAAMRSGGLERRIKLARIRATWKVRRAVERARPTLAPAATQKHGSKEKIG